jgi:hypothetical protein
VRSSRKRTAKDDKFLSHARQSPFAVRQSWRMAKKNGNGGRPFTNVCHASPLETHGKQNHKNKKKFLAAVLGATLPPTPPRRHCMPPHRHRCCMPPHQGGTYHDTRVEDVVTPGWRTPSRRGGRTPRRAGGGGHRAGVGENRYTGVEVAAAPRWGGGRAGVGVAAAPEWRRRLRQGGGKPQPGAPSCCLEEEEEEEEEEDAVETRARVRWQHCPSSPAMWAFL